MMPLSRRLDWVITKSKCVLSAAGSAQIMTMGRRVGIERKEGGKVESRTRKKSRMEKGEVNGGGGVKEDEEERAGGSLPALRTAKCIVWGKWSEVLAPPTCSPHHH